MILLKGDIEFTEKGSETFAMSLKTKTFYGVPKHLCCTTKNGGLATSIAIIVAFYSKSDSEGNLAGTPLHKHQVMKILEAETTYSRRVVENALKGFEANEGVSLRQNNDFYAFNLSSRSSFVLLSYEAVEKLIFTSLGFRKKIRAFALLTQIALNIYRRKHNASSGVTSICNSVLCETLRVAPSTLRSDLQLLVDNKCIVREKVTTATADGRVRTRYVTAFYSEREKIRSVIRTLEEDGGYLDE